jgi:tyrosine-protein kinase Etk/Wzc
MPQAMQAPFLGHVPLVRTRKPIGKSLCEEITQKQFMLVESVRLVRTALLLRLDSQRTTMILITSATPGTGKSNFTMILGKSLAQTGKKILMIDVDFYKRTLSKRFDVLDKPGLLNCLSSKSIDTGHVFPTETPGLCVMPAGKRSDEGMAFEEIANGAFKTCMSQLSKQCSYDIVLLDSAPILLGADATILASQVDGTIMVEREHVSRRSSVVSALTRLNCAGGRLLGTVFIGSGGGDDYGYRYGYDRYRTRGREV